MAKSGFGMAVKWGSIVVAIGLIAFGVIFLQRMAEFRSQVAQLKEQGYPVSYTDLTHEVGDPDRDALTYIVQAADQLDAFVREMNEGPVFVESREINDDVLHRWDQLCDKYPELFELIEKASNCSDMSVRSKGEKDVFTVVVTFQFGNIIRLTRVQTRVLIARDQGDDAVQAGLRCLRLARLASQHPDCLSNFLSIWGINSQGLEMIHEALAKLPVGAETRQLLNEELERNDWFDVYQKAIRAERAIAIASITEHGVRHVAINGNMLLKYFGGFEVNSVKEMYEVADLHRTFSIWSDGPFLYTLGPIWHSMSAYHARNLSLVRALRTTTALQMAVGAETQSTFDKDYLVSIGVPERMTIDTATGNCLQIKLVDGRWIVYSVGLDGVDNNSHPSDDWGFHWPEYETANDASDQ